MSDLKKCPYCGKLIHNGAQYCMFCMHSLVAKEDITAPLPQKKNRNVLWLAVVCLVILGLLAGTIYYIISCLKPLWSHGDTLQTPIVQTDDVPEETPDAPDSTPSEEDSQPVPPADTSKPDTDLEKIPTAPPSGTTAPDIPVENQPDTPNIPDTPETPDTPDTPNTPETPDTPDTPTTQQPVCAHTYLAASCIAPTTCTLCGDTLGNVDPSAHSWKPVYALVHHDEVGHYETKEVHYKKIVYLCFFCGYNQDGYDSLEELREHITVHAYDSNYGYVTSRPDLLADDREVWATKYEEVWVVDQKAYDENRLIHYTCSLCNSTKPVQ